MVDTYEDCVHCVCRVDMYDEHYVRILRSQHMYYFCMHVEFAIYGL
jgi:hypothetical protein